MNKLLLFLLLCYSTAFGQNYNCLQYGPKRYFTNGNGYLRGIRIDSVVASSTDSFYYPFRTARVAGYNTYSIYPLSTDYDGGSWLGKKVIKKSDGTWLFDNIWNDTVVIKSQAILGDSWIFFDDATNVHYTATVTSVDTMTVWGALDSIKTLTITADTAGIPRTWDPANNFKIKLSKEHGFVQAIDLYTFPYHMPDSTSDIIFLDFYLDYVTGRNSGFGELSPVPYRGYNPDTVNSVFNWVDLVNPRKKDVFDFNDGDIYQSERQETIYSSLSWPLYKYYYYIDTVFGTISTASNKSFNTYAHYTLIVHDGPPPAYVYHYDLTGGGNYDTTGLLSLDKMPEEVGSTGNYYYFPGDTVTGATCTIKDKYIIENNHIVYGDTVDPVPYSAGFDFGVQALGTYRATYYPFYGLWATDYTTATYTDHRECTYMFKNGSICYGGYRSIYDGVSDVNKEAVRFELAPNPANENVTIKTEGNGNYLVVVFNMLGQVMFQSEKEKSDLIIPLAVLPNGIYNFVVVGDSGARTSQRLQVSH